MTLDRRKALRRTILKVLYEYPGQAMPEPLLRSQVKHNFRSLGLASIEGFGIELEYLCENGYAARYVADRKIHLEPVGIIAIRALDHLS